MIVRYPIGNGTRDLPPCKTVPQPVALSHTALANTAVCKILLQDTQVRACECVCVFMYTYVCMYVCTYVCMYVCMGMYVSLNIRMYLYRKV